MASLSWYVYVRAAGQAPAGGAWRLTVFAGWVFRVQSTSGATYNIGLKKYTADFPNGQTQKGLVKDLTAVPNSQALDSGGTAVLATGVCGLLLVAVALVFMLIYTCGTTKPLYLLWFVVILFFIAGLMLMAGGTAYAQKINLSYSFLAFIFAGPANVIAAILMTHHFCSAKADAPVALPPPTRLED